MTAMIFLASGQCLATLPYTGTYSTEIVSAEYQSLANKLVFSLLKDSNKVKLNQSFTKKYKSTNHEHGYAVWGANIGFWAGKFVTHLAVQVAIGATALVVQTVVPVPGSGAAVGIALEKTLAVPAEYLSNIVGLATGLAGAVASGPV